MKILVVAGARPNFVKVAPLLKELGRRPDTTPFLVHTGQLSSLGPSLYAIFSPTQLTTQRSFSCQAT